MLKSIEISYSLKKMLYTRLMKGSRISMMRRLSQIPKHQKRLIPKLIRQLLKTLSPFQKQRKSPLN